MVTKKRAAAIIVFVLTLVFLCGCETVKGATCGVAGGVATGATDTAKGVSKDANNFWQTLLKADDWFQKNLW